MRLLMVADYLGSRNPSGAGRYLLETARALVRRGHDVRVLAGGGPEDEAGGDPFVVRFPFPAEGGRAAWLLGGGLASIRKAYDAMGWSPTHLLFHQPLSAQPLLDLDLPRGYVFHSPWGDELVERGHGELARVLRAPVERRALRRIARVATLSAYMEGRLRGAHPGLGLALVRAPGGADLERFAFSPDPKARRPEWDLPADRPVLLTVRRLVPRMGLEALLEALSRLPAPRPFLAIAGRGPLEAALRAKAAALGLERDVRFLGYVEEGRLPGLLGAADLFVLPSQALEGFGMVIAEAMACGTPVLGSRVGAIPEVVGAFEPDLVCDRLEPGLLKALSRLPGRDACRSHAERHFAWDRAAEALERLLGGGPRDLSLSAVVVNRNGASVFEGAQIPDVERHYHGRTLLEGCLKPLSALPELLVVDNASTDRSRSLVPRAAVLLENPENRGFAPAVVQASFLARGRFLLLVNSDVVLEEAAALRLLARMEAEPRLGILGCRLRYPGGRLQPSGGRFPTPWGMLAGILGLGGSERLVEGDPDWVAGGVMLVRREAWDAVGGMDPGFLFYEEDADFCLRVRKAGWGVAVEAGVEAMHVQAASASREPAFALEQRYRSLLRYARKHFGRGWAFAMRAALVPRMLLRAVLAVVRGEPWSVARAALGAPFRT